MNNIVPAGSRMPIDLTVTTPTLFVGHVRTAARFASRIAHDPLHVLDNNPFIAREWTLLGLELDQFARRLEGRYEFLFSGGLPVEPRLSIPDHRAKISQDRDRFAERDSFAAERERAYWDAIRQPTAPIHQPRIFTTRRIVMIVLAAGAAIQVLVNHIQH